MRREEDGADPNEIFNSIISGSYSSDEKVRLEVESQRTIEEIRYDDELEAKFEASKRSSQYLRQKKQRTDLGRTGLAGFVRRIMRRG